MSRAIRRLNAALALGGVAAAGAALAGGAGSLRVDQSGAGHLGAFGLQVSYPALNLAAVLLLALAGAGAVVVVRAVAAAVREARGLHRALRGLSLLGVLPDGVVIVDRAEPLAFCAGWLRPRVYLSVGAMKALTGRELEAVLAHERAHARARDPLRLATARVLAHAVFFLPLLGRSLGPLATETELAADAAAMTRSHGDPAPLAAALLVFDGSAPGGVGVSAERVDRLLGRPVRWSAPRWAMAGSLAALAALVAATWLTVRAAHATTSLALPLVSKQPCVLVLAVMPLLAALALSAARRRSAGSRARPSGVAAASRAAPTSRAPARGRCACR